MSPSSLLLLLKRIRAGRPAAMTVPDETIGLAEGRGGGVRGGGACDAGAAGALVRAARLGEG